MHVCWGTNSTKTFLLPGKLLEILLPRAEILRCRALVNKIQHESEVPEACANTLASELISSNFLVSSFF